VVARFLLRKERSKYKLF